MNYFRVLIPVALFLLLGLSSCQSSKNISKDYTSPACTDKLYLELQKRDSSSYTLFEKKYFLQKKQECANQINKKEHDEKQALGEKIALGMVIAGGLVGAFLLVLLIGGFKQ